MKKRKRETMKDEKHKTQKEEAYEEAQNKEDDIVSFSDYTSIIWRIDTTNVIHPLPLLS